MGIDGSARRLHLHPELSTRQLLVNSWYGPGERAGLVRVRAGGVRWQGTSGIGTITR